MKEKNIALSEIQFEPEPSARRYFRITEISEDEYFNHVDHEDWWREQTTGKVDGAVYVAINDNEMYMDVPMDVFDEEEDNEADA